MADVSRSTDYFLNASTGKFLDNVSGAITAQMLRDFAVSMHQPQAVVPGGRLTLTSGTPVTVAEVTSSTSIYYTPFIHNTIGIFDGTSWKLYTYSELTFALGTLTSGANYDLFVWDNAGTVTLSAGPAWTSDTARGTGAGTTQLSLQDGVYVNTVAISGGPGAKCGRYVGTFRTISTTATADFGGTASQTGGKRFLWNAYNRRGRNLSVFDSTDSWTYTTNTWRQANGASGNKVEYVCGLSEDVVEAQAYGLTSTSSSLTATAFGVGVGVDATNANSAKTMGSFATTSGDYRGPHMSVYSGYPGIGYHYLAWLEVSQANGTTTWFGDNGVPANNQSGLVAKVMG